jgi:hypothetical protein
LLRPNSWTTLKFFVPSFHDDANTLSGEVEHGHVNPALMKLASPHFTCLGVFLHVIFAQYPHVISVFFVQCYALPCGLCVGLISPHRRCLASESTANMQQHQRRYTLCNICGLHVTRSITLYLLHSPRFLRDCIPRVYFQVSDLHQHLLCNFPLLSLLCLFRGRSH